MTGSGTLGRSGSRKDGLFSSFISESQTAWGPWMSNHSSGDSRRLTAASLEVSTSHIPRMRGARPWAHGGSREGQGQKVFSWPLSLLETEARLVGLGLGSSVRRQVAEGGQPSWGYWASGLGIWGAGLSCHRSHGGSPAQCMCPCSFQLGL